MSPIRVVKEPMPQAKPQEGKSVNDTDKREIPRSIVSYRVNMWGNQAELVFQSDALERTTHVFNDQVGASGSSLAMLGEFADLIVKTDGWENDEIGWLLRHGEDTFSLVKLQNGFAGVRTASNDEVLSRHLTAQLIERICAYERDETVTPVTFWCLDQVSQAPLRTRRTIETMRWIEISTNYTDKARNGMERLLALEDCPEARLIVWHGPTGTGKTHALRALAREWSPWCDVAFISDPEEFIGGVGRYSPSYLFHVSRDARPTVNSARSVLIVLEDSGELMSGDARSQAGQGLSRLLNLTDGMLGQGLNVMVLITTNEPLSTLHSAVRRPGRLLAEIEFGSFSPELANDWLEARGSHLTVDAPTTLAELYAVAANADPIAEA